MNEELKNYFFKPKKAKKEADPLSGPTTKGGNENVAVFKYIIPFIKHS